MIMMAPENRETMHKGLEASLGCVQAKRFLYGPPCLRSFNGQTMELKYTNSEKQANVESETGAVRHNKFSNPICEGPIRQENYYVWPALSPAILKDAHGHSLPIDGCFYSANYGPYFRTHWFPQAPLQVAPQSYYPEPDLVFQDFQYFVVIDFEATCDKDKNPHPQEIIEFPSVLVNSRTGQVEDSFQMYVRPTHNQHLTEFCKELTGIQQSQVDKGVLLSEVLLVHDKWLEDKGIKNTNFAVVTWSDWDCRVMLESECRFKKISKPQYFNRWINLKIPFNKIFGSGRRNLKEAVELAGLTWEGRAHCGLDDAKNTAHLLTYLMRLGFKLSITNYLKWQTADHSSAVPLTPDSSLSYQPQNYKTTPPFFAAMPFYPFQPPRAPVNEPYVYCYCGATSTKRVNKKPGPKNGCFFFGCGNWTANRGPACQFFKWVSVSESAKPT